MPRTTRELTIGERHAAFLHFSTNVDPTTTSGLRWGTLSKLAKLFAVDRSTMSRLWRGILARMADDNITLEELGHDISKIANKVENRGRTPKYDRKQIQQALQNIPLKARRNYRTLSVSLGIPTTTLHQIVTKENVIRRHSSALIPALDEQKKVSRLLYCIEQVYPVPDAATGKYYYKTLYGRVDVDEKWFRLTEDQENYFLVRGNEEEGDSNEEIPVRRTRNKNYVTKVLFLCAQAHPCWDPHRNGWWDGKLGMWPIGSYKLVQRGASTGQLRWKDKTITQDVYRELLLEKVVVAIEQKWPRNEWNNPQVVIRIQQDGPNSHIKPDDADWILGLQQKGLENKLLLYTQPANSPDLNINDLGFFRALQSHYQQFSPTTAEEIINYVRQTYEEYPRERINHVWLTLMEVMNEIIEHHGDNDYKMPHIGKLALERRNELPVVLPVTEDALIHLGQN